MEAKLHPYLNFDGTCREAMTFYQECLGGKLTMQTFGDAPVSAEEKDRGRIMHAMLDHGALTMMASDCPPNLKVTPGNSVHLSLVGSDAGLKDVFAKLSEGGTITMPLEKQFWGDTFGMLTDKFGMHWMVNISAK